MRKLGTLAIGLAVVVLFSTRAPGQDHPKEHPQPSNPKVPVNQVSIDDIDKSIRDHIEKSARTSGGRFEVKDNVLKKTWDLELVRVHKDKLQALADGRYFACVDFKAPDGTMVDVDFFMKKGRKELTVTDTTVHKINGKARYNYRERNGVWVRVAEKA